MGVSTLRSNTEYTPPTKEEIQKQTQEIMKRETELLKQYLEETNIDNRYEIKEEIEEEVMVPKEPLTDKKPTKKVVRKDDKAKNTKNIELADEFEVFTENGDLIPSRFVNYLTQGLGMKFMSLHFEPETIRILDNGVYKKDSNETPVKEVLKIIDGRDRKPIWYTHIDTLIKKEYRLNTEEGKYPGLHKDYINCLNGFIDLKAEKLISHDEFYERYPNAISFIQIPVEYHEDAICPEFDAFLLEKMDNNEEDVNLIYEAFGYCMLQYVPIPAFFEFQGASNTGKSTTFEVLFELLGTGNYSTTTIHDVDNPERQFARGQLYGVLANIDADSSEKPIAGGGLIKKIAAGDPIAIEKKFVDERTERVFATLLYSANYNVKNQDKSDGIYTRMIRIPFTVSHKDNPQRGVADAFKTTSELQGVFKKSIDGVLNVLRNGNFTKSERVREALEDYKVANDPVMDWCEKNLVTDHEILFNGRTVLARYNPEKFLNTYRTTTGDKIDKVVFNRSLKSWAKVADFKISTRHDNTGKGRSIPGLSFRDLDDPNDDFDNLPL